MRMLNRKLKSSVPTIILIVIALLFLIPLIWLVLAAVDIHATQALRIPSQLSVENFRTVLAESKNTRGFLNSLIISVVQTLLVLVFSVAAAYPLSRYRLKSGQRISMFMLFLTSIPITALMVPV